MKYIEREDQFPMCKGIRERKELLYAETVTHYDRESYGNDIGDCSIMLDKESGTIYYDDDLYYVGFEDYMVSAEELDERYFFVDSKTYRKLLPYIQETYNAMMEEM